MKARQVSATSPPRQASTKLSLQNPRAVIAFDFDGDGATDLLITQNNLPPCC